VQIDSNQLKFLLPLKQLQADHRRQLTDHAHIAELAAGERLSASEESHWFVYLLQGRVKFIDNEQSLLLKHSDERAAHPLFAEGAQQCHVLADSHCLLLRVDKQMFHSLVQRELLTGEEVENVEMSEVEGKLFNDIMQAYNTASLQLPSLPEIALKVKKALSRSDTSALDVARIVAADPVTATRLIAVANGPLNRGVEPVTSIQQAVVRLGTQVCKNLVMSFAMSQLFKSRSAQLNQRMHQLYDRSVDVAAIAFALSRLSGKLNPDHVLLAGLLHDIGEVPILAHIEKTGLLVESEAELDAIVARLKGFVGAMVVRHWELPDDLLNVVENYDDWQRNSAQQVDVSDMITAAAIYSRLKHHELKGLPKIEQVPAFAKIFPARHDAEFVHEVLENAHDEVVSIMQLLRM
jgi:HD-like signal output (HDOD) protein